MNKVILVDDEIRILKQLEKIIPWNELGYEIIGTFKKVRDVIAFLENDDTVDLIITDIKMPDMSGLELAEYCHTNHPNISLVIISAYDDFKYAQEAIRYNVADYITKPISKEKLINTLNILSEKLSVNKNNIYSDKYIQKKITLFESAYLKKETHDILEEKSCEININIDWDNCESVTIVFPEKEFKKFMDANKYEANKFVFMLSKIINQETKTLYSSVIKDEEGKIKILLVSKAGIRKENFLKSIEKYITVTEQTIDELFGVKFVLSYEKASLNTEDNKKEKNNETLNSIIEYIENNYDKRLDLKVLAKFSFLNESYLCQIFKKHTKMTVTNYINKVRIEKAKTIIETTDTKLSAIPFMVGFSNTTYFHRTFKKQTGYSPKEYKSMFSDKTNGEALYEEQ